MTEQRSNIGALVAILLAMAMGPMLGSSINLCIPAMEVDLAVDAAAIGWTVTVYTIAIAALSVPLGKIADLTSHRSMFVLGMIIMAAGSALCGFAGSFEQLLIWRVLQATGGAMSMTTSIPLAVSMYSPEKRGKTIGICTSAVYVGGSCGPVIGGLVSSFSSWRVLFWAIAALITLAIIIAVKSLGKSKQEIPAFSLDVPGNILYIMTTVLLLVGLTGLTTIPFSWAFLVAGLVFAVLFALVERKVPNPVLRLSMFTRDRIFTLSSLAALFNYAAVAALTYLLSLYFQSVLGWSSAITGFVLLAQPIVQAVAAPISGALSDRMAAWKIATLGMSCSCVALLFFSFVQVDTPLWLIIIVLLVAGLGFGIFSSPNTSIIMGRVDPSEFGSANAVTTTMRTVGMASSMSVVTIAVGLMMGTMTLAQAGPDQILATIHVCFGIFVVICALGIVCSLVRR